MWNRNGRELFYRSADKMMVVDIALHPSLEVGRPGCSLKELTSRV